MNDMSNVKEVRAGLSCWFQSVRGHIHRPRARGGGQILYLLDELSLSLTHFLVKNNDFGREKDLYCVHWAKDLTKRDIKHWFVFAWYVNSHSLSHACRHAHTHTTIIL